MLFISVFHKKSIVSCFIYIYFSDEKREKQVDEPHTPPRIDFNRRLCSISFSIICRATTTTTPTTRKNGFFLCENCDRFGIVKSLNFVMHENHMGFGVIFVRLFSFYCCDHPMAVSYRLQNPKSVSHIT